MAGYTWGGGGSQQQPQQAPSSPVDEYSPRAKLAALIFRAEVDPDGIGKAVRQDPMGALQSIGFSQGQAEALTAQPAQADDPVAALAAGCNDTSCLVSLCPATCFVTIPGIPGICRTGGSGGGCSVFSLF